MKIAVTGKGGVGKTTTTAFIARALKQAGHKVIAIDADPDSNLAACMGYPHPESIRPLVELKDLIEERTGMKPGTTGGMFILNPKVDDIPEKFSIDIDGIKVLVAGAVKKGGSGCYCPENAFIRNLVSHLLLDPETSLILDMEAGVEHLSRGTVRAVDWLVTVVEPAPRSVETALRIKHMAAEIGLTRIAAVGNRIRVQGDRDYLVGALKGIPYAGFFPFEEGLHTVEIAGKSVVTASATMGRIAGEIVEYLQKQSANKPVVQEST